MGEKRRGGIREIKEGIGEEAKDFSKGSRVCMNGNGKGVETVVYVVGMEG